MIYMKYIATKYKYNLMIGHDFFRLVKKKRIVVQIKDNKINVDNEYLFDDVEDAADYIVEIIGENK